jgi:pimeloyl-ACP methyl ester carboxylesterase
MTAPDPTPAKAARLLPLWLILVLIAALTACVAGQGETPPPDSAGFSPGASVREEVVTVEGGQLHLWCAGSGPTVLFLSGIGGDHTLLDFGARFSDEAYACFYDRPGDGPPPPDRPRTAGSDAADLHELLAAAQLPTPVVLVAHSYGGLIAVIEAAEHPEEVAGVVFVDSSQPDAEAQFYTVLTDAQRAYFDGRLDNFPHVDWPTSLAEAADALRSFPDVPVTVITATRSFLEPCDEQLPCDELQAIWLAAQDEFVSSLAPDARHVLAETGHYVHDGDPELVEREVRDLLARIGG